MTIGGGTVATIIEDKEDFGGQRVFLTNVCETVLHVYNML